MKFAELKAELKKCVNPVCMLYGTDMFLLRKSVELITAHAGVVSADLDVSRLNESSTDLDIISACQTVSFCGGKRVVIVRPFSEVHQTKLLQDRPRESWLRITVVRFLCAVPPPTDRPANPPAPAEHVVPVH